MNDFSIESFVARVTGIALKEILSHKKKLKKT